MKVDPRTTLLALSLLVVINVVPTNAIAQYGDIQRQIRLLEIQRQQAEKDAEDALRDLGAIAMRPLQDEAQISYFEKLIGTMNKPRLDAFADVLSSCSSGQDCSRQLENYELKFQEKQEDKVINAFRVANNQYKPSSLGRPDKNTADNAISAFKVRIQPAIRKRYSEL